MGIEATEDGNSCPFSALVVFPNRTSFRMFLGWHYRSDAILQNATAAIYSQCGNSGPLLAELKCQELLSMVFGVE